MSVPDPTARLRFREMGDGDLDVMAAMLGDPEVMRFYPHPKDRAEAQQWIDWNQRNYASYGYGLWIVETHEGDFVGDCGLTWQQVDHQQFLEIGYHTTPESQGLGYATEAARRCVEFALQVIGESHLIAIIDPANTASRRVAEKVGMTLEWNTEVHSRPVVVYALRGTPTM